MKKEFSIVSAVVLLLALLLPSPAHAANDCIFKIIGNAMMLTADCATDETIFVPDGFLLNGDGHTITAVDPPGGHFQGAVVQNAGATATVRELTITVSDLADVCDEIGNRLTGILFVGASGNIRENHVLDLHQGDSTCDEGVGIEVANFVDSPDMVTVKVEDNIVTGYQRAGIIANENVFVVIRDNTLEGQGRTDRLAQTGIQLGFGARGRIEFNRVSGHIFTPQTFTSAGILLFGAGDNIRVHKNEVSTNDVGIWLTGTNLAYVHANTVTMSEFDAIVLDDRDGNVENTRLEKNDLSESLSGIALFGPGVMNNSLRNNYAHDGGDGFFIGESASLNTLINNQALNNLLDGFLLNSEMNTLRRNRALGNGELDIEDVLGNNTYIRNECETSSGPPVDCGTEVDLALSLESAQVPTDTSVRPGPSPVR